MDDMTKELLEDFLMDAREHIESIEMDGLSLNSDPNNLEIINNLFREFHTLKGLAGFVEQVLIQNIAHKTENILSDAKQGKLKINSNIVNLILKSVDYIKKICDDFDLNENPEFVQNVEQHLALLDNITSANNGDTVVISSKPKAVEDLKPIEEILKEENNQVEQKEEILEEDSNILEEDSTKVPQEETEASIGEQIITPDMIDKFVQETDDLLNDIEQNLLLWLNEPDSQDIIDTLYRSFHSLKGNSSILNYTDLEKLSHHIENIFESHKQGVNIDKIKTAKILLKIIDIVRETVFNISNHNDGTIKYLELYIELLNSLLPKGWLNGDYIDKTPRLGEILIQQGLISQQDVEKVLCSQRKSFGELLLQEGLITEEQLNEALKKQESYVEVTEVTSTDVGVDISTKQSNVQKQNIRVSLDKLDSLINLIGELVIAENMLIHNPDLEGLNLENFHKASQHMNKIIRDLQEISMVIRMVPVASMFRRMSRLVYDLASKFNKKVNLKIIGEETELDKTVIETITDPLIHIIRNAIDHGIESRQERIEKGKPEAGLIKLIAKHEEGEVWIIVEDDGRGLNKEKILKKAIQNGLIQGDGSQLSEKEIFSLIFLPGFSTAENVTDISGRGVGMDVVKQNIEKIKGKVEIRSEKDKGTTFILRIPLTLAIIEGMMVKVCNSKFIIPILNIREFFRPDPSKIHISPEGDEIVRVREKFYPILRLHNLLKTPVHKELTEGILILIEADNAYITVFVDEILGQQQTVIKGLSEYIGNIQGISGCTILGNGEVCLILNVNNLVEMVGNKKVFV